MKRAAGICVLVLLPFLLAGCAAGSTKKLYAGSYVTVTETSGKGGESTIHVAYSQDAVAAMENGEALCETIAENAQHEGGTITLSDGRKISLDLTVQMSSGQSSESMYGMTASSLQMLEDALGTEFLIPEGLQEEKTGNQYALTADPDFDSIAITSVSMPWETYTAFVEMDIFPIQSGSKVTDDSAESAPECRRMESAGGLAADVLVSGPSKAQLILRKDGVLYDYTLSSGEDKTIQEFLDSLS